LVQIVLSGQPELEEKLCDPMFASFASVSLFGARRCPLTSEETKGYIAEDCASPREPARAVADAVQLVYRYSRGSLDSST